MTEPVKVVGRNEPCPCGSGKKYKRCHGVTAAPKVTPPKNPMANSPLDPNAFGGFDPQMMMQVSQALQRLPKGQLQRLQVLMQKAMSGKDITAEAAEFERTLPPDFQNLMKTFAMPQGGEGLDATSELPALESPVDEAPAEPMTEEKARELVEQAVKEGSISREQADALLKSQADAGSETEAGTEGEPGAEVDQSGESSGLTQKFGRFWRNMGGKKSQ